MRLPLLFDAAPRTSRKPQRSLRQPCAVAAVALWICAGGAGSAMAAPPPDPVRELLRLVERQRAAPAPCRPGASPPARLRANPALAQAAALAPRSGGSDALNLALRRAGYAAARSTAIALSVKRGYAARSVGENVAAGQGSAEQVVADRIASPGHCENLMFPAFTEMGAAYVVDLRSAVVIYWTQVFARPLRPTRPTPTPPNSATQAR